MTSLTDPAALTHFAVSGATAESLRATRGTEVTFPLGATSGRCRIVATLASLGSDYAYVVSDRTPFHPCDQGHPAQPGDRGYLQFGETRVNVLDSRLAEYDLTTDTVIVRDAPDSHLGQPSRALAHVNEISLTEGGISASVQSFNGPSSDQICISPDSNDESPSIRMHVAHIISASDAALLRAGMEGVAHVDSSYRNSLSIFHSAYHLTVLAFNRAARRFVSSPETPASLHISHPCQLSRSATPRTRLQQKRANDTALDALGEIDVSSLFVSNVVLSDKGFSASLSTCCDDMHGIDVSSFMDSVPDVLEEAGDILHQWIESDAMAEIDSAGPFVGSSRHWLCYLPEADVSIQCDGTHAEQLSDLAGLTLTCERVSKNEWTLQGHAG